MQMQIGDSNRGLPALRMSVRFRTTDQRPPMSEMGRLPALAGSRPTAEMRREPTLRDHKSGRSELGRL